MELSRENTPAQQWSKIEETYTAPAAADLSREVAAPQRPRIAPWLTELIQTVLLTLVIFVAVRSVIQNFQIDGPSMQPTLRSGQYLLVTKLAYLRLEGTPLQMAQRAGLYQDDGERAYLFGPPQHGDIIVFQEPVPPYIDLVKRVIAVPGDQIQIDSGRVYVNGVQLKEEYVRSIPSYSLPLQRVPPGQFFVLGDNRPVSSDSHLWGFVPEGNIIGKAWIRYWPPEQWGVLPAVNPLGG